MSPEISSETADEGSKVLAEGTGAGVAAGDALAGTASQFDTQQGTWLESASGAGTGASAPGAGERGAGSVKGGPSATGDDSEIVGLEWAATELCLVAGALELLRAAAVEAVTTGAFAATGNDIRSPGLVGLEPFQAAVVEAATTAAFAAAGDDTRSPGLVGLEPFGAAAGEAATPGAFAAAGDDTRSLGLVGAAATGGFWLAGDDTSLRSVTPAETKPALLAGGRDHTGHFKLEEAEAEAPWPDPGRAAPRAVGSEGGSARGMGLAGFRAARAMT